MLYKYRGSLHTRMRTHTPPDEQNQSSGTAELRVEEVTGTGPHESLTTHVHVDNDSDGSDDGDGLDLAPKPNNDSGPVVPPSEGGLTEDALLALPLYTGDDDEEPDEDLSTVAYAHLAAIVGVQGHPLGETAEPQLPIPNQKEGEPLLEATNKPDNTAVDTDPKLAVTDVFAKDLRNYILRSGAQVSVDEVAWDKNREHGQVQVLDDVLVERYADSLAHGDPLHLVQVLLKDMVGMTP